MNEELIPCPFCGGNPSFNGYDTEDHEDITFIECEKCYMQTRSFPCPEINDLINLWNTRKQQEDLIK